MMPPDWLVAAIAMPAASILVAICVGSAVKMSLREAASQRSALAICIAVLMLLVLGDRYLNLGEIPVVRFGMDLVGFTAGCGLLYFLVVAVTFLFRPRFRGIGTQMAVVSVVALWWMFLVVGPMGANQS